MSLLFYFRATNASYNLKVGASLATLAVHDCCCLRCGWLYRAGEHGESSAE
jgi:hypothetical protein